MKKKATPHAALPDPNIPDFSDPLFDGADYVTYGNEFSAMRIYRTVDQTSIPNDASNLAAKQFLVDWEQGADVIDTAGAAYPYTPENVAALGFTLPEGWSHARAI